ncbi:hypothetical protein AJ79_05711 [Helicocarpus griseus UAMH5409]|uniref:Uncharacterized protein n=1 Tax=Helicocarpus griseus UAMH5409 TaxID=1447875 RepID=A0A2B7XKD7_9EURO|nr:hypothetical protein AJ79_05711 [Helicocarpus griseus UAMH5409]
MGCFSCYCAICGGPGEECSIGSSVPEALEWRRKRVARKRKKMLETGQYPSIHVADDEDDKEELNSCKEEVEGGWDKSDEDNAYDPGLVSEKSLEWLLTVHCLGVHEEKAFISGPGEEYDQLTGIDVEIGDDPNQPSDETHFFTYGVEGGVFPFHWVCLQVLLRALGSKGDPGNIDKAVLFDVMENLTDYYELELDYGQMQGRSQNWISVPGEEYSVTNPIGDGTEQFIREIITRKTFKVSPLNYDIQKHVVSDPFDKLPFDILYNIFSCLPGSSVQAISKASWSVTKATRYNGFWKQLIFREMNWFWELNELLSEDEKGDESNQLSSGLSLKRLYLYIDKKTTPTYVMDAEFMSLGNRRRIWRPCQQVAELYFAELEQRRTSQAKAE